MIGDTLNLTRDWTVGDRICREEVVPDPQCSVCVQAKQTQWLRLRRVLTDPGDRCEAAA